MRDGVARADHATRATGAGGATRAVVVVAAGAGTRLAQGRPKAFVDVGGRSILARSLEPILAAADPFQIVVVVPAVLVAETLDLLTPLVGPAADHLVVVAGGDSRQASVAEGLAVVGVDVDTVLVHDTARCFTPTDQFDLVTDAVRALGHGVVPGLAVSDTIKRITPGGQVAETIDRAELVAMQTPQGFPRADLDAAYAEASLEYTDDAALFAAAGHDVTVVAGDPAAFKITTPWDLQRADTIAREAAAREAAARDATLDGSVPQQRVGIGIDVHAFAAASSSANPPMRLGTLDFPGEIGLAGHSDGDAVAHAIVDALLSAAGLGDIGSRFGTDDPRYAGAPGDVFLTATVALLADASASIGNVAVQVVGNRPRLATRRVEMEQSLTRILGAPVSVSATTTDGLGFTGRGEGVTVVATALVHLSR